jgi:hypothetical protein
MWFDPPGGPTPSDSMTRADQSVRTSDSLPLRRSANACSVYAVPVCSSPFVRRETTERAWTEHLATNIGARALLEAVRRAHLPEHTAATLDEILDVLVAEATDDVESSGARPRPSHCAVHQLHVAGRFPDVAVFDPRDRLFAVVEAQRGRADDHHIAKLAANYVPRSGARLGILVAEGWGRSSARHPAWADCPAPVVVVVTLDALSEPDYQIAWVHHPTIPDGEYS